MKFRRREVLPVATHLAPGPLVQDQLHLAPSAPELLSFIALQDIVVTPVLALPGTEFLLFSDECPAALNTRFHVLHCKL
jgi:hypothetical protein